MPSCAFRKCNNNSRNTSKGQGVTFHSFPQDVGSKEQWVKVIQQDLRDDKWLPTKFSRVCSGHFNDCDFYFTPLGFRKVKPLAVPLPPTLAAESITISSKQNEEIILERVRKIRARRKKLQAISAVENAEPVACNLLFIQDAENNLSDVGNISLQPFKSTEKEVDEPERSDDVPDNYSLYYQYNTASVMIKENNDERRHEGFLCENCNGYIIGYRYTCVQCNSLDLCITCEASGAHADHYMLRVPGPKPYDEIQTVLMTIRKYLMRDLDPTPATVFDNKEIISLKFETEPENMHEDMSEPEHQVDRLSEDATGNDLGQFSRISSQASIELENTDSKEALTNNKVLVAQRVKVLNVEGVITQNPVSTVLTKTKIKPIGSEMTVSNAKSVNRNPLIMTTGKQRKVISPSTAKRKMVNKESGRVEEEQSNRFVEKIYLVSNMITQQIRKNDDNDSQT